VETIVHIRSGDQVMLSLVPGMANLHIGDGVRFDINATRLHYFSTDGLRLI